ncbi:hypothetical protein ACFQ5J_08140 [Lacticaseibacillus baoqingensis]|uniref:Uncharacterized protein n=1 Tax=Lacticaseibacillus baoqingensis TaxID=2486013 RepID=A0ABW4E5N6_9LACO|nr:hypothetical protein [Lacticaseibacillus baoqingensis]
MPSDPPESDVDILLTEFINNAEVYMANPDIPVGAILSGEEADLFADDLGTKIIQKTGRMNEQCLISQ